MTIWFWECRWCMWQGGTMHELKSTAARLAKAHDAQVHRGAERTFAVVRQRKVSDAS